MEKEPILNISSEQPIQELELSLDIGSNLNQTETEDDPIDESIVIGSVR